MVKHTTPIQRNLQSPECKAKETCESNNGHSKREFLVIYSNIQETKKRVGEVYMDKAGTGMERTGEENGQGERMDKRKD